MSCLYYYKLVSEYPCDVTKGCKLAINEIDSNFYQLKGDDIKSAEFIRDEKILVLTRNNEEKLIVPLNDMAYDLNIDANCSEDGVTLSVYYDGKDGVKQFKIDHLITLDMLRDKIEELIGTDILTKVITDGTLKGYGTLDAPLGLNGTEKTGMYAPVIARVDLTQGGKLPEVAKLGTRYATIEYINDYGYLYNGSGLKKIADNIEAEGHGWRVPSKQDWDMLLNLIEPCEYRNHDSARCHVELGKVAGKYLKSVCGWVGEPNCECSPTVPITSCTFSTAVGDEDYIAMSGDSESDIPQERNNSYIGVDKYGMSILPSGVVTLDGYGRPQPFAFREKTVMWSTTHVHGDVDQDQYVKVFDWDKGGVFQEAECPAPFYSVRLVKDYNGSNYFDTEYIDGIPYKTILFPEIRQIWLARNYAKKEGFTLAGEGVEEPEIAEVNDGQVIEKRKAVFLNEWNGCYWEKKELNEGDTVVVENTCFDVNQGETISTVCWLDEEETKHCVDVVIPDVAQYNIEYRVFTTGGTTTQTSCDQDLVNTDYLAIERLLRIVIPILEKERQERIETDEILSGAIETERQERISGDTDLWEALYQEASARTEVDNQLWDAIAQEASARTEVDDQIWTALNKEINDRLDVDAQMWAAINAEAEARETTDNLLWDAINAETTRAQEVEAQLWDGINGETARAQEVEGQLWTAINGEIERAIARENEIDGQLIDWSKNPFTITAAVGKDENNLVLESKDGNQDHFIKVNFNGSFGKI